jgi:hypothetical protein
VRRSRSWLLACVILVAACSSAPSVAKEKESRGDVGRIELRDDGTFRLFPAPLPAPLEEYGYGEEVTGRWYATSWNGGFMLEELDRLIDGQLLSRVYRHYEPGHSYLVLVDVDSARRDGACTIFDLARRAGPR